MKYSWKGHKDKKQKQEQNKKVWASEGEPAGITEGGQGESKVTTDSVRGGGDVA